MKQILQNLNKHVQLNVNEPYRDFELNNLITNAWSCKLKTIKHRTRNVLSFDNIIILRWTRDTIELLYEQNVLYKSPVIATEEITISLALSEGFIRIQGSKDFDGTHRLTPSNVSQYIPKELTLSNQHIITFGEPGIFAKEEALKNMSGLDFWVKDEELILNPSESIVRTGFHIDTDFILFLAIEPYEYVSKIQDQLILKISNENYSNEYFLTYSEEEFGNIKDQESLRRLFIKQRVVVGDKTYEEVNPVDLIIRNWLIRNERPGPPIYFISTQTENNDKTIIQNYNYNKKWFTFDEVKCNNIDFQKDVNIQIGGTYQGKIKEIFLFNRKLVSQNAFEDQSIKWIMAYLKQKYAITDTLIDLK